MMLYAILLGFLTPRGSFSNKPPKSDAINSTREAQKNVFHSKR